MSGRLWKIWEGSFNGALSALLKKQEFLLGTQFPIRIGYNKIVLENGDLQKSRSPFLLQEEARCRKKRIYVTS